MAINYTPTYGEHVSDELASTFVQATQLVEEAQTVNVIGHINPDADAIGSVCAVVNMLGQIGRTGLGFIGQDTAIDPGLLHIPGATDITLAHELPEADLNIVVDCGASSRTGYFEDFLLSDPSKVIVIDHHDTNPGFGGVDMIDHKAAATTCVLREWFRHFDIELTTDLAHALYAGLATDTSGFRWGRPKMHATALELVNTGLDIPTISSQLFDDGTVSDLVMIGRVLRKLRVYDHDGLHIVVAMAKHRRIEGHGHAAVERIAGLIRGANDGDIYVVFKEYVPGEWTVSLRADNHDVAQIARHLGGGGHLHASGYTTAGDAEAVVDEIRHAIASFY